METQKPDYPRGMLICPKCYARNAAKINMVTYRTLHFNFLRYYTECTECWFRGPEARDTFDAEFLWLVFTPINPDIREEIK